MLILKVISNKSKVITTEKQIKAAHWYQVLIEETFDDNQPNVNVYVNMEKLKSQMESKSESNTKQLQKVDFFLGKSVDENVSSAFKNAEICIDNIAIWKRTLSSKEKYTIYSSGFGKFFYPHRSKEVIVTEINYFFYSLAF